MQYVKFFSELKQDDIPLAGGKAASLGEMTRAGLPVPPGFCLTTEAYRIFVTANELQEQIITLTKQAGRGDRQTEAAASTLRTLFTTAPIPEPITAEITAAYDRLRPTATAVRSSATAEDLPGASFAGQQDTFLNIRGTDEVAAAVRRCWASLWTARAIAYRQHEQIAPDDVAMAVIVQELVPAAAAGVLFTANPVTGAQDEIIINAAWGLGEAIVSGLVTPDNIVVNKETGRVKVWHIADKQLMTARATAGIVEQVVPEARRTAPTLDKGQVSQLVALARAVEKRARQPVDLEWAIADGQLHLLQARPITALPPQPEQPDLLGMEWSRLMLIERYPDPVTPFTWSVINETFFSSFNLSMRLMGGNLPEDIPLIRRIYGRPYLNVTLLNQAMVSLPIRPPVASRAKTKPPSRPRPALRQLPGALLALARLANLLRTTHRQWVRLQAPFETAIRQEAARPWETFSTAELLAHITRHQTLVTPLLDNHARSIIAAELSLQLLQAITRAWLDDDDKQLATTLLSGLTGNVTVATNRALWWLAAQARPHDQLRQAITALAKTDLSDDGWRAQLAALPGGPAFLAGLDDFLQAYGHRSPRYEMMHPTWLEQPGQILDMVRLYLDEAVTDPGEGEAQQAAAQVEAAEAARRRLPLPKRLIFDRVLPLAQTYFRLRENQQFYLTMSLPTLRRILLILGRRLQVSGKLHEAEDVFFLENRELRALAAQLAGLPAEGAALPSDPAQLVAERQTVLARYQTMTPPVHLGDGVDGEDTAVTGDTVTSANTLRGIPASRGTANGRACLVRGPEDFGKLQPGEILVAPATTPAWTPLFGVAAGLVTDYGGLLSHAGVVAREYGLPAVLGTNIATQTIQDGDEIRVDGDRGVVSKR